MTWIPLLALVNNRYTETHGIRNTAHNTRHILFSLPCNIHIFATNIKLGERSGTFLPSKLPSSKKCYWVCSTLCCCCEPERADWGRSSVGVNWWVNQDFLKGLLVHPALGCWERTILCEITHFLLCVTLGCQNWKPSKSWVIVEDGSCYFKYFGEGLKSLTATTIASISGSSALNKKDYRKAELNQEAWPASTALCVIHWLMQIILKPDTSFDKCYTHSWRAPDLLSSAA